MLNKAKNGGAVTHAPFGYEMVNKQYVVDEERAPIVRMVFEDFTVNGLSTYLIAKKLQSMGVKTLSGREFGKESVRYIVNNPVYIGKVRWNADMTGSPGRWMKNPSMIISDGIHEAIIPANMWERGQELEAETQRLHKPKEKTGPARTMLAGILRCGSCGSAMCSGNTGTYQCGNCQRGVCHVSHSILREKLEKTVVDKIDRMFEGGSFELEPPPELPRAKSESEVVAAQIKKQEQKLDRIKEAYENGVYNISEMKKRLTKEQSILEALVSTASINAANAMSDMSKKKKKLMTERKNIVQSLRSSDVTTDGKNALLKTFVDRIVFNRTQLREAGTVEIYLR
jgi:hypothetical protein